MLSYIARTEAAVAGKHKPRAAKVLSSGSSISSFPRSLYIYAVEKQDSDSRGKERSGNKRKGGNIGRVTSSIREMFRAVRYFHGVRVSRIDIAMWVCLSARRYVPAADVTLTACSRHLFIREVYI